MFAKLSTALVLFAASVQVAVATPPACLIAAVNAQPDPSDLKAVCGDGASEVKKYLSSKCGGNSDAANDAFEETCKDAGVEMTSSKSSSSASHSATGYSSSSSHSGSHSASASATGTGSMTSFPSGTAPAGTGSGSGTGNVPYGTAGASSGFSTMTGSTNGTYSAPSASGSSGPASPTESGLAQSTGGAARLGMDVMGLAAVGVFGAILAL